MDVLDECQLTSMSFDPSNQVGAGGFGYVVKGHFHGVDVAVKTIAPLEITVSEVLQMKSLFLFHVLNCCLCLGTICKILQ